MSDAAFFAVYFALIPAAAIVGGGLGRLVNRLIRNQTARRLMLAQVWISLPLLFLMMLLSLLLILSIGSLLLLITFFLLGVVVGLAPWEQIYSH